MDTIEAEPSATATDPGAAQGDGRIGRGPVVGLALGLLTLLGAACLLDAGSRLWPQAAWMSSTSAVVVGTAFLLALVSTVVAFRAHARVAGSAPGRGQVPIDVAVHDLAIACLSAASLVLRASYWDTGYGTSARAALLSAIAAAIALYSWVKDVRPAAGGDTADLVSSTEMSGRRVALLVVLPLVGAAALVSAVALRRGGDEPGPVAVQGTVIAEAPVVPAEEHEHLHGVATAQVPLTGAEQAAVDAQLKFASRAVSPLVTVADAEAAGFVPAGKDMGTNNNHLVRWDRMDDMIEIGRPEMLLAQGDNASSPIIALVYFAATPSTVAPAGFAGANDSWHEHRGVCVVGLIGVLEGQIAASCKARGGRIGPLDGWMLHVWAVPGHPNSEGVFVAENPVAPTS